MVGVVSFFVKPMSWLLQYIGCVAIFSWLLVLVVVFNWQEKEALDSRHFEKVTFAADHFLNSIFERAGVYGELFIAEEGKEGFHRSYGVLPGQSYILASVSKSLTATAIAELVKEKKLKVSDKVCSWISLFCRGNLTKVEVEHLLSHRSGLRAIPNRPWRLLQYLRSLYLPMSLKTLVEEVTPLETIVTPGDEYNYSNQGFMILSKIVEEAFGGSFDQAMEELVYDRYGMTESGLTVKGAEQRAPPELSIVWPFEWGHSRVSVHWSGVGFHSAYGAGGIFSTVFDLARFGEKVLQNKQHHELLFSERLASYGAGWVIQKHGVSGEVFYWHNGRSPGYSSLLLLFPENKRVVVWLSNTWMQGNDQMRMSSELRNLFSGRPYHLPFQ